MLPRPSLWREVDSIIRAPIWRKSNNFRVVHFRYHSTTTTSIPPSSPTKSRWLQVAIITIAAGGIGTYIRYRKTSSCPTLNPFTFTRYELIAKEPISSTCSVFTVRPIKQERNFEVYEEAWKKGLWSVQFKQPQLQVGRDYTPLPPLDEDELPIDDAVRDADNLRFLIRREREGEVSGYLHSLKPGAVLEFRGPQIDYEIPDDVREVLFIAGGTGIAPALQAAHTIFRDKQLKDTRMRVLWANRRREDCTGGRNDSRAPPQHSWWSRIFGSTAQEKSVGDTDESQNFVVLQLEKLKGQSKGRLSVEYFVDEENSLIKKEAIMNFTRQTEMAPDGRCLGKRLILISGPDGFVRYLAGPKLWRNGVPIQGPLQGLLKEIDLKDWSVWKM